MTVTVATREAPTEGEGELLRRGLAADLAEWAGAPTVWSWVQEEVASLDWKNPQVVAFLRSRPNYHAQMWLCLLGYALVRGIYEADEIGRRCCGDPVLRGDCESLAPTGRQVTRFRRENLALVRWLVTRLFRRAVVHRYELGGGRVPAGLKRYLGVAASRRLDLARLLAGSGEG